MRVLVGFLACIALAALTVGCASPWPQSMPPTRYAGTVVNASLGGSPESGATITAVRPALRRTAFASEETLGSVISDSHGCFVLQTRSGYATELRASSADNRRTGDRLTAFHSKDRVVLSLTPSLSITEYQPAANPSSKRVRGADAAIHRLLIYLSAHPQTPLRSLRAYASEDVISAEQFAFITQEPNLFLGWSPEVKYFWGKYRFVFLSADAPIAF